MFFTREPIVESVITPREGCKLVIRNSKGAGQEEYFVDAVEVVNFGTGCFFRSLERPKSFLVPCTDYEVLEVRETRMVLRHITSAEKPAKSPPREKAVQEEAPVKQAASKKEAPAERKKERRKRRRKGREEREPGEEETAAELPVEEEVLSAEEAEASPPSPPPVVRIIPPPKTLISDSIGRYKEMLSAEAEGDEEELELPEDEDQPDAYSAPFSPSHLVRRYQEGTEEDEAEERQQEDD